MLLPRCSAPGTSGAAMAMAMQATFLREELPIPVLTNSTPLCAGAASRFPSGRSAAGRTARCGLGKTPISAAATNGGGGKEKEEDAAYQARLDKVRQGDNQLHEELGKHLSLVGSLKSQLAAAESREGATRSRLVALESRVEAMESRLGKLEMVSHAFFYTFGPSMAVLFTCDLVLLYVIMSTK